MSDPVARMSDVSATGTLGHRSTQDQCGTALGEPVFMSCAFLRECGKRGGESRAEHASESPIAFRVHPLPTHASRFITRGITRGD